jgi:phenylalanyl-tRNA synthetase alpha subunit
VLGWGEYADWVLVGRGGDPERHVAVGIGLGLERLAQVRYGIDDLRKMATTSLA